ncbi:MAG: hypothetical protein ACI8Z1_004051, partial [Candidatus Azotimanducaceae bacterium]
MQFSVNPLSDFYTTVCSSPSKRIRSPGSKSTPADFQENLYYSCAMKTEPKRRDAEETRLKILESARCVFTDKGYERAGLREICRNAGVDQALIKRYFGSKLKLFEAVFDTGVGIHLLLLGPTESIG